MNSKNRFWGKALAALAVGGVLLSGFVIGGADAQNPLITDASAGVSGGGSGGGGGGGGGGSNSAYWAQIPADKLNNGSIDNIPGEYWNDPVCRNAIAYFGLVPAGISYANATGGGWTYSFYGTSRDPSSPSRFPGGSDVAGAIAGNVGQSWQWGSDYMIRKNFICLDDPNVITATEMRYEVRDNRSTDSINENEIHTLTTQIAPQPINVGTEAAPVMKNDPVGADNLNTQTASKLTNYGRVWNEYKAAVDAPGADVKNIVASFKERFRQAKEADKTDSRASVNLNEGNQAGMGEGGILNVNEFSKRTRASASTATTTFQVWRCGWAHYSKTGWQNTGCASVGGTINPDALNTWGTGYARWDSAAQRARYTPTSPGLTSWQRFVTTINPSTETQQQIGFWQIISAHCNEKGIADLRAAMGADLVPLDSGDSSSQISGLLRTKFYSQQPTILPLGARNAATAAQRETSKLGFFDKECPFDCTPNRSAAAGATDANGAVRNVAKDGYDALGKGLSGAKSSDNVNSNYAEIFRDNTERTIRPDVWYPISGQKGVSYSGEAPKTTMVTRWAGGTPDLGSEFNAYAVTKDGKTPLFNPDNKVQTTQKNFDAAQPFASSTAGQIPGLLEAITVQSTWASNEGKPQALQVAWEYSPSVSSRVPTGISFTPGGTNVQIGSYVNRNTNIDGRCWGEFGQSSQSTRPLSITELRSNTGTGATSNFTVPNGSETTARNLVLNFVRGTSE